MFVVCISLQRHADKYLAGRADLKEVRSIIRYYVSMTAACVLLNTADPPSDKNLAKLLPTIIKPLDEKMLETATDLVLDVYKALGSTETIAKGPEMRTTILRRLRSQFVGQGSIV